MALGVWSRYVPISREPEVDQDTDGVSAFVTFVEVVVSLIITWVEDREMVEDIVDFVIFDFMVLTVTEDVDRATFLFERKGRVGGARRFVPVIVLSSTSVDESTSVRLSVSVLSIVIFILREVLIGKW